MLLQKRGVCTKFDIYIFTVFVVLTIISILSNQYYDVIFQ